MSGDGFLAPRQSTLSSTCARAILFWMAGVLAGLAVLTHVSQFCGLSFRTFACLTLVVAVLISLGILCVSWRQMRRAEQRDRGVLAFVLLLGLFGTVVALVSHRPCYDDYQYIPAALHHFENPDEPMGFEIRYLDGGDEPFTSHYFVTSIAYEYGRGVAAFFLNVEYLYSYYLLTVAIVGFLIPLALFYAISRLSDRTAGAAVGALICVLVLLLLGETHYTFGNFTFTRAFHGKTLLLSVGLPFFVAATVDFFSRPSLRTWLVLFAVATGFVGVTTTAIIILAGVSVPLFIAILWATRKRRRAVLLAVPYFASLTYLVVYAVLMAALSTLKFSYEGLDPLALYVGHARHFLRASLPLTPVVVLASTVAALLLTVGARRRFLLAWIVAVLVLYLNPVVARPLMWHVTTPYLFWRMFYLVPFPLVLGVATAAFWARSERRSWLSRAAILAAVCVPLVACHLLPGAGSVLRYRTHIGWPGFKLRGDLCRRAYEIIQVAPAGVMLAPPDIAEMVPCVASGYPQVHNREYTLTWWGSRGLYDEVRLRTEASRFAGGAVESFPSFREIMRRGRVRSVVLARKVGASQDARSLLSTLGYDQYRVFDRHVVLWR